MKFINNNRTVVFVRRPEHLRLALSRLGEHASQSFFICQSIATYLDCERLGLQANFNTDYNEFIEHDFTNEGHHLAEAWIHAVMVPVIELSEDEIIFFRTQYTRFFSMAIASLRIIEMVFRRHKPDSVLLWTDRQRPILGDWFPSESEGDIFARVCKEYLSENGIQSDIIEIPSSEKAYVDKVPENSTRRIRRKFDRLFWNKLKPIYEWFSFNYWVQKAHLKCRLKGKPLLLFLDSGTNAAYASRLGKFWCKSRGWIPILIESHSKIILQQRKNTRGGDADPGFDLGVALRVCSSESNLIQYNPMNILDRSSEWWKDAYPDFKAILGNSDLCYQFKAMITNILNTRSNVSNYEGLISKIKPDVVLSHWAAAPFIAAKLEKVPSIAISHGLLFAPSFSSMHGDINFVAGRFQKQLFERSKQATGKIKVGGSPYLPLLMTKHHDLKNKKKTRQINNSKYQITFIVPNVDYYFWSAFNFSMHLETCRLLQSLSSQVPFKLIVKLHPRYADHDLYRKIFDNENHNIRISFEASLEKILDMTDIVILAGHGSATVEVIRHNIPVIWCSYYAKKYPLSPLFKEFFSQHIVTANNLDELKSMLLNMMTSKTLRENALKKQEMMMREVLDSAGEEAARQIGDEIAELLEIKKKGKKSLMVDGKK